MIHQFVFYANFVYSVHTRNDGVIIHPLTDHRPSSHNGLGKPWPNPYPVQVTGIPIPNNQVQRYFME